MNWLGTMGRNAKRKCKTSVVAGGGGGSDNTDSAGDDKSANKKLSFVWFFLSISICCFVVFTHINVGYYLSLLLRRV